MDDNASMRVLQVVTIMNHGGLESLIMNLYRSIDRDKIQFDFLVHRQEKGTYEDEITALGGKIYRVPRANPFSIHYWQSLNGFFESHPIYSVVHSHIDCMSALPLAVAKKHGVTMRIAHSHNSCQDKDIKYPVKLICKHFIRYEANTLFACGVEAGRWMFDTNDFLIFHNAININEYIFNVDTRRDVRKLLSIPESAFVIGHVGRFSRVKNQSFLLDIFKEIALLSDEAVLLLIGDGELKNEIEEKAAILGISDRVRFLGLRDDVARIMQALDVFVMPSLYEGLPVVMVEAQTSGLPCCISSSIPTDCDITNLVTRVSLGDSALDWAETIVSIKSDNSCRSRYAKDVKEAGFDISQQAKMLEQMYLD